MIGILRDHVTRRVDIVDIITQATGHRIGASPAIERVISATAGERVVASHAPQGVMHRCARQGIVARRAGDGQGQRIYARDIPYRRRIIGELDGFNRPPTRSIIDKVSRHFYLIRRSCYLENHVVAGSTQLHIAGQHPGLQYNLVQIA